VIKFYCLLPGLEKTMPIVPSGQIDFNWVAKARKFFSNNPDGPITTKCPGIFSVLNTGWIQRTYMDITIETFGDKEHLWVNTEIDQRNATIQGQKYLDHYVSWHWADQFGNFREDCTDTLKTLIKIQSPWFVDIPKGYSLLMMPVPYNDDTRFTAATGLLKGKHPLNVQLYWHCLNSKEVIKAGTPISQMILIKDQSNDYEIEVVEEDLDIFFQRIFLKL
jgi:hypothetical protein